MEISKANSNAPERSYVDLETVVASERPLDEFMKTREYEDGTKKYQELLMRSATDPEFREKLKTEPHAAIEEFHGTELPAEIKALDIHFIDTVGDATIVLPDPVLPENQLSEDELESVAGGSGNVCASAAAGSTTSVASAAAGAIISGGIGLIAIYVASQ
jgi:hypothetical protein